MRTICLTIFAAGILLFGGASISAATAAPTLILDPEAVSVKAGDNFTVKVIADPGTDKIDTIRAALSFTPGVVEISNVSKNAEFSYSSGGNQLNNSSGQFSYGAGMPGGTTQKVLFLSLNFKAKQAGKAEIRLTGDSLLLSEGINKYITSEGNNLTSVDISANASYQNPSAAAGNYPDGSLLRSMDGKIYLIKSGQKKKIHNLEELKLYFGRKIINVSDDVIMKYPAYKEIVSGKISYLRFGDGNLIKDKITKKIYLVTNSMKKHIPSPDELRKYAGVKIYEVDKSELDLYPITDKAALRKKIYQNNSLMRDSKSNRIYAVKNGMKIYISSQTELKKYSGKKIINTNQAVIDSYPSIL